MFNRGRKARDDFGPTVVSERPNRPGAVRTRDELRSGMTIRRHYGDGLSADYRVIGDPVRTPSSTEWTGGSGWELPVRQIYRKSLGRRVLSQRARLMDLADLGILPYANGMWSRIAYTVILKRS